jgi:multiple sugar transport system permease protein
MASRLAVFKQRFSLFHLGLAGIAFIGVVVVLFPILWMVVASMRPGVETLTYPPIFLPQKISWTGYEALIADPVQRSYLVNTYIIALLSAMLSIFLGSLAAYGFSRFRLRGATAMLIGILSLQMLPGVTLIIPYFNFAQGLGIHNTYTISTSRRAWAFTIPTPF